MMMFVTLVLPPGALIVVVDMIIILLIIIITIIVIITPRSPHCCGGYEPGYDKRPDQPHGHHLNQEEGRDDGGDLQHGELQMSPHNTKKKATKPK